MLTEERIMMNVAAGDLHQLGILFDKYHLHLYNYFFRLNYDKNLSQDLTQNVFERILKYRRSYKDSFPFKAWLFKIARNVNTDYYRGKKIQLNENVELKDVKIETENVLDCIEKRERTEKLEMALKSLAADEREILVLSRFEEMKYSEIGALMGISESSIKVKVHRAIKKLRNYYENSPVL